MLFVSCGAPSKQADDVLPVFDRDRSLASKIAQLCTFLHSRQEPPQMNETSLLDQSCSSGGLEATSHSLAENFRFLSINSTRAEQDTTEPVLRLQTRAEGWLGHPLLSVVRSALNKANQSSNELFTEGESEVIVNEGYKITILEKPAFDEKTSEFSVSFDFLSLSSENGQTRLNNKFDVKGILVNDSFAVVSITTQGNVPSADSYIQRGKITIAAIPHEQDMLLISGADFRLHDFGVKKSTDDEFFEALSAVFKEILSFIASQK